MKVNQCCNITFPWFYIMRIHGDVFCLICIFISKSGETVSELMYYNLFELIMMCHRQIVRVKYAASAIFVCIYKYDDVFIWSACQYIVHIL
ncbi:unknown [Prevotella sp. CAG:487]|nr:unknown [Prevotella sp. CAG:487]